MSPTLLSSLPTYIDERPPRKLGKLHFKPLQTLSLASSCLLVLLLQPNGEANGRQETNCNIWCSMDLLQLATAAASPDLLLQAPPSCLVLF